MKVSVVIPVYQVEAYIEECLLSVQGQTLTDIEIICVNDCGTDASWDKVQAAAGKDSRIRLLENPRNMGLSASRNHGLSAASGEYVYFLDSDDMIEENALEELYALSKREDLDAAVFCASFIYENEELRNRFSGNPAVFKRAYPSVLSGKELYRRWMEAWDWMPSQPRFFYRRSFLNDNHIRFWEGVLHEDEIFAFDVLMKAARVRVCPDEWFIRRFRASSIMTGRPTMKNVEGCIHILQHLAASQKELSEDPSLKKAADFYRTKIVNNVWQKFWNASDAPNGGNGPFCVSGAGPLISVVIPVYNAAPYLEECLYSVLSQDLIDFEVICVDDGSTDESPAMIRRFIDQDPRIRGFNFPQNRGQAAARNKGLCHARGKYVYMLDADDWIVPGALRALYDVCVRDDLDVLGFENRQYADEIRFQAQADTVLFSYGETEGLYSGKDAFITCVEKDTLSPSVPTFMLKRAYIGRRALRFQEGILHEDIGFIFEMLTGAERVRLWHKPFFCRRFRAHSTVTGGFTARHAEGYLKSWEKAMLCREELMERFGPDRAFWHACRKWSRDVAGRIRVLYAASEKDIYREEGTFVDETTRSLLELVRQTTTGRERAKDILGEEMCLRLEEAGEVYICGTGQYANRMADAVGALNVTIRGFLAKPEACEGKRALRGFPLLSLEKADPHVPTILAVSHYQAGEYRKLLQDAGYQRILETSF